MVEITYTLIATTKANHSFQLGKELKSPKMIVASLLKTAYPPTWNEFTSLVFVKHTKTIVSEELNIDMDFLRNGKDTKTYYDSLDEAKEVARELNKQLAENILSKNSLL